MPNFSASMVQLNQEELQFLTKLTVPELRKVHKDKATAYGFERRYKVNVDALIGAINDKSDLVENVEQKLAEALARANKINDFKVAVNN